MTLSIPFWVILSSVPILILIVWAQFVDGQLKGGGSFFPATSDRDGFYFIWTLPAILLSVFVAFLYFYGATKGWWKP